MGQKVTLGGDRLGSGKNMKVTTRTYDRSTHNLSYVWRSSMAPGTLVPYMNEVALPGDTWDINLNADVKTLPTLGPLFGSFKLQLDVFTVPIRLYVSQLHNNKLGVGMNMSNIKLPQINIWGVNPIWKDLEKNINIDNLQISNSSILKYLGVSGIGYTDEKLDNRVSRKINAVPLLGYWDIFKNYYANKQEKKAYVVSGTSNIPDFAAWDVVELNSTQYMNTGNGEVNDDWLTGEELVIVGRNLIVETIQIFITNVIENERYILYYKNIESAIIAQTNNIIRLKNTKDDYKIERILIKSGDNNSNVKLESFDLENLDIIRENLLTETGQAIFNDINEKFNIIPIKLLDYKAQDGDPQLNYRSKLVNEMEGLAIKTYQSDIFNNWLNEEWINGINGISAITKVSTADGGFTIDTLNLSKKVYDMLNQIAVSGGSYDDWIRTVYDTNYINRAETPVYQGGLSKEIVFNEVVSTAGSEFQDSQDPIGTLAGRGVMSDKHKGGKLTIRVDEPSYIMGIVSITPRIDYSQGNRWDINLKTLDDLHKPALDGIGFQDLITEQMHWGEAEMLINGNMSFKSAGKQPAWLNYMTNYNRTFGDFADNKKAMFMTLNRRYSISKVNLGSDRGAMEIQDLTSYIDPANFNQIFADGRRNANNFWVQIAINANARRKMSAKIIPNL